MCNNRMNQTGGSKQTDAVASEIVCLPLDIKIA